MELSSRYAAKAAAGLSLWVVLAVVGLAIVQPAVGQLGGPAVEAYGYTFLKVGSPGNRPATEQEAPAWRGVPFGSVGYEYRMSKLEVTTEQWLEFVKAYTPYYTGSRLDRSFTGLWITPKSLVPGSDPQWTIAPGADRWASDMSWRYAARYVNWLNNDKRPEKSAFENGAYDTSTFTQNPDGTLNDQIDHNPGAKFWIPTHDEWVKAAYYDPDRYGPGQEGYWLYPDKSQSPLVPGFPPAGQTIAGIVGLAGSDVGQFPDVQTPWGLLDISGGWKEWTETVDGALQERIRMVQGAYTGDPGYVSTDRLDIFFPGDPRSAASGLRLASSIPSPTTGSALLIAGAVVSFRRKRHET